MIGRIRVGLLVIALMATSIPCFELATSAPAAAVPSNTAHTFKTHMSAEDAGSVTT